MLNVTCIEERLRCEETKVTDLGWRISLAFHPTQKCDVRVRSDYNTREYVYCPDCTVFSYPRVVLGRLAVKAITYNTGGPGSIPY